MALLHRASAFLKQLFHRRTVEAELDEEVGSFYETVVQDYVDEGMPPDEARRRARLKFSPPEQVKEQVRDAHAVAALDSLARHLRCALRALRQSPSFAAVTMLTLALGIGANVTIFSIISRFALRPAPVGDPETLMDVLTTTRGECCNHFSWPAFSDLREQAKSFSGIAAYYDELIPASINGTGAPERVWGQGATTNFFDVTRLGMTLGRGFLKSEDAAPVVVLGNGLWRQRFGSDPAISGKTVTLSGHPFTVVGVAPPGFRGVDLILDCQFWVPLGTLDQLLPDTSNRIARDYHWLAVLGRLNPGVSRAEASSELKALAQRFERAYPKSEKDGGFRLELAGSIPPRDKSTVLLFFAALLTVAFLVLCIACANVANLFLAHVSGRQREISVRFALGATRGHLLRQMLTESILLGLAGGVLAVLLSLWATRSLAAFRFPAPVPLNLSVDVDGRVLLYTFVLSILAGVVFGLAPAWTLIRPAIASGLKGEDALATPGRFWTLRNVLVVAQIAMSIVLLCATGLFLRSLQFASRIDIGFRPDGIIIMAVDPRLHGYSPERVTQFLNQARQRMTALPGVASATYTDSIPLSGGHRSDGFQAVGRALPNQQDTSVEEYMIGPGYWETMGTSILAGRDFANESAAGTKVALVNQVFARELFGGGNPVGQLVMGRGVTYRVIGMVNNIKSRSPGEDLRPVLYRSLTQDIAGDPSLSGYRLAARCTGDPAPVLAEMRRTIHSLDPSLAIFDVQTIQEHLKEAFFLPRLGGWIFGIFGALGLTLAAVGLYGVINSWVTHRTREIGIRLALGARVSGIQWLIVRQGMLLMLSALLPGLGLAWGVSLLFTKVLLGVNPHDALTFLLVPVFLSCVGLAACWLPARRAASAEPLTALRHE